MSLQRTLSISALIAATFVFVDAASSQPRAADKPPAAASAAQPKGMQGMTTKEHEQHRKDMHDKMHGDKAGNGDHCAGMMDKHKNGKAHDGTGPANHGHDTTASADKACGMGKKH